MGILSMRVLVIGGASELPMLLTFHHFFGAWRGQCEYMVITVQLLNREWWWHLQAPKSFPAAVDHTLAG